MGRETSRSTRRSPAWTLTWTLAFACAGARPSPTEPDRKGPEATTSEPSPEVVASAVAALRRWAEAPGSSGGALGCQAQETIECIHNYHALCESGQGVGCLLLAIHYVQGDGVAHDEQRALDLLVKGCETDPRSCSFAGLLLANGVGDGPPSDGEALVWFRRGCERRDAFGCVQLARMLLSGRGGDVDARAIDYALQGCDGGEVEGCGVAGITYLTGGVVEVDERRAESLLRRACDGGYAQGCTALAIVYAQGTTIPRDYAEAAALYRRSCDAGDGLACRNLGFMHRSGEGVAVDESEALRWFRAGCEAGDTMACDAAR